MSFSITVAGHFPGTPEEVKKKEESLAEYAKELAPQAERLSATDVGLTCYFSQNRLQNPVPFKEVKAQEGTPTADLAAKDQKTEGESNG